MEMPSTDPPPSPALGSDLPAFDLAGLTSTHPSRTKPSNRPPLVSPRTAFSELGHPGTHQPG